MTSFYHQLDDSSIETDPFCLPSVNADSDFNQETESVDCDTPYNLPAYQWLLNMGGVATVQDAEPYFADKELWQVAHHKVIGFTLHWALTDTDIN